MAIGLYVGWFAPVLGFLSIGLSLCASDRASRTPAAGAGVVPAAEGVT